MSTEPSTRIRRVLDTPRGQRFVSPGATLPDPAAPTGHSIREQRLLAQMRDNPRVAYRLEHGVLPAWMEIQAARLAQTPGTPTPPPGPAPERPAVLPMPRPRPAPDDRPPRPPGPRRTKPPLPRRPRGHRKPRPRARTACRLAAYTLAVGVGALAHHLAAPLF